jgi:gluconolactonase
MRIASGGGLACMVCIACAQGCGGGSSTKPQPEATAAVDGGPASTPLVIAKLGTPVPVGGPFYFTEGPVWDPAKNVLYFTDINATDGVTVGGAIYRLTPPDTIDVMVQPSGNADGLGLDPAGNIVAAGFVSRDVWRLSATNAMQTLAPCAESDGGSDGGSDSGTCYAGQELNTPDDVTSRSDGVLYFTDPTFGSGSQGFPAETLGLSGAQGVYRLTTDGVLHLEEQTTDGPNGVNLSPDEKTLYVSYTLTGDVARFDVAADGSLAGKTTFATGAAIADSMCVDSGGHVYVGTLGGLAVYDPTGAALGTISVGGLIVTNCAFGGADQRTLFITARTTATLSGPPPLGGGALYEITNMPVPGIPGRN